MASRWLLFTLITLTLLAGCREPQGILRGPIPAIGTPERGLSSVLPSLNVIDVSLADLLDHPAAYKDKNLQVTGTFRIQQTIPCGGVFYHSPATWLLGSGSLEMPAAGPSNMVPDLPVEEVQIKVEGRWKRWIGLAGCGDEAIPAEVWYLETSNVISPEEVALVPVGSDFGQGPPTDVDSPNASPMSNGAIATTPAQSAVSVPTATLTTGQPIVTPASQQASPVAVLTPTIVQGSETTIPTPTMDETATPIPGSETGTAVLDATSTGSTIDDSGSVVSMPTLNLGSLETGHLQDAVNHLWPYAITEVQVINLQIAPEPGLSVGVSISNPNGQMIVEDGPIQPGQSLILTNVPLTEAGTYEILVSSTPGSSGNYAILIGDDESYNFVFSGFLDDGDIFDDEMGAESDHFWQFTGDAGQVIDIVVTPKNIEDLFLRLFGPDGTRLVEFYDLGAGGEAERLTDYTLTDSGLYSLLVGENDFETAEYTIELSKD